jgi:hypothetical protein
MAPTATPPTPENSAGSCRDAQKHRDAPLPHEHLRVSIFPHQREVMRRFAEPAALSFG